jgi:phosphatidate phosphatase PAH1
MSGFFTYVSSFASAVFDFNAATLSGALDIIAITNLDGSIACTPFHVRFGKWKILRSRDKLVYVYVNGVKTELVMQVRTIQHSMLYPLCVHPIRLCAAWVCW